MRSDAERCEEMREVGSEEMLEEAEGSEKREDARSEKRREAKRSERMSEGYKRAPASAFKSVRSRLSSCPHLKGERSRKQ